jgi:hypothetical protein
VPSVDIWRIAHANTEAAGVAGSFERRSAGTGASAGSVQGQCRASAGPVQGRCRVRRRGRCSFRLVNGAVWPLKSQALAGDVVRFGISLQSRHSRGNPAFPFLRARLAVGRSLAVREVSRAGRKMAIGSHRGQSPPPSSAPVHAQSPAQPNPVPRPQRNGHPSPGRGCKEMRQMPKEPRRSRWRDASPAGRP